MTSGDRLDKARDILGLSLEALAKQVGVTGDAIGKAIKRNNIKTFYLNTFQEKFGISRKYIETGEGEIILSHKDMVSEPSSPYGQFQGEIGVRLLNMLREYVPEDMTDILDKLDKEMIDLYEYREAYLKAKEMYRPK